MRRYFRAVLQPGQPLVSVARFTHVGQFNTGENQAQWSRFTSSQVTVTQRPGFDWDARIALAPGLHVFVHDAYRAGEGILHGALLGLVTVADLKGTAAVAQGELMRFLAEAAWYPTALLPVAKAIVLIRIVLLLIQAVIIWPTNQPLKPQKSLFCQRCGNWCGHIRHFLPILRPTFDNLT